MKEEKDQKINLKFRAFIPLFTFLGSYLGVGLYAMYKGYEKPFSYLPKECALLLGLLSLVFLAYKSQTLDHKIEVFTKAAGEDTVILMALIFILAGTFASVAKATECDLSVVNLGLSIIPPQFLCSGIFAISAVIALAVGTSNGTVAAIAPIALGFVAKAGLSPALAMAAVVGGAMFGDNLSVISDTTIAATRGCGAKMSDKFKMNFFIALPAAIITCLVYAFTGRASVGAHVVVGTYSFIKIVPYFAVLVSALIGINVIIVLFGGTVLVGIVGIVTGSLTLTGFFQAIGNGVLSMAGLVIVTIMIRGLSGIAQYYGGIDWLLGKITKNIKTRKGAEYAIATMCTVADACVGINTIGVLISVPLAVPLAKKFNISKQRVASLVDIFTAGIQGLLPHAGQILLACTLSGISPFAIISKNYYQVLLIVCSLVTIQFGLLKTKEEKNNIPIYEDVAETSANV